MDSMRKMREFLDHYTLICKSDCENCCAQDRRLYQKCLMKAIQATHSSQDKVRPVTCESFFAQFILIDTLFTCGGYDCNTSSCLTCLDTRYSSSFTCMISLLRTAWDKYNDDKSRYECHETINSLIK